MRKCIFSIALKSRRSRTLRKTLPSTNIKLLTQLFNLQLMVLKLREVILISLRFHSLGVVRVDSLFGFGDLDG